MRKFIVFSSIVIAFISLVAATLIWFFVVSKLPSDQEIQSIRLQIPMRVYTADNKLLAEFGEKRRIPMAYEDIPKPMIEAFIAAEDDRFFDHHGVDIFGLMRAAVQLVKTGRKSQGGSTITMQTARNVFLSRQKTYMRKLSEILLAIKMEKNLSKEKILQLYLNKIYLGNRSYGVGAAAQAYYGKTLNQLTLAEIAMIAGLPKAPSRYNPVVNAERARIRRDYVLGRMLTLGFISGSEYKEAMTDSLTAMKHGRLSDVEAPYLAEMVRAYMVKHYGEEAYSEGYRVTTTVTAELQELANRAVRKNLINYDTRHGYRGAEATLLHGDESNESLSGIKAPQVLKEQWVNEIRRFPVIGKLLPAVVVGIEAKEIIVVTRHGREILIPWQGLSWARPFINENQTGATPAVAADIVKLGDVVRVTITTTGQDYWRLAQIPQVEGSMVALAPNNGAILSLVGGFDFTNNKFNHVTQARRQLGSNFKPFLYSAALEYGYTPATLVNDAPVVFDDAALETVWRPENYSGKFFGPTRLRKALYTSRNLVSIRLLQALGIQRVIDYVARFGFIKKDLPKNLSLALGSASMPLLDVARGYAVFANNGYLISPYFIQRIENRNGKVLFEETPVTVCKDCTTSMNSKNPESLSSKTNVIADDNEETLVQPKNIAHRVVDERNVYLMTSIMRDVISKGTGRRARSLKRKDLAGKTGTTNDQKDAWFSGFNQDIVATVWVGFDKIRSLGARETGSRAALPMWIEFMRGALKNFPEKPLVRPLGLATVRIDPSTGGRVRPDDKGFMLEVFREENIPEYVVKKKTKTNSYESPETLF